MTDLMRSALQALYHDARDAHPGLLLQRGYPSHDEQDSSAKTNFIERICNIPASDYYQRAYRRWHQATANPLRFRQLLMSIDGRLYIGLSAGGMLETGCAIGHAHGLPYLPGSSIKGAVHAQALRTEFARRHPEAIDELFGAAADPEKTGERSGDDSNDEPDHSAGLAGCVAFHDAWWVPGSAPKPMVRDVVTTHHPDYYGSQGRSPASDLDSPVPNAQIAVRGSFLLVLEGDPAWTELATQMTITALAEHGMGAKTRGGYGFLSHDQEAETRLIRERDEKAQQAEQQRRRAAMSDEQRLIDAIRTDFEQQRQTGSLQAGGPLGQQLGKLMQTALTWPAEYRSELADFAEAFYAKAGWGKGDKKRKKRNAIATLRNGE